MLDLLLEVGLTGMIIVEKGIPRLQEGFCGLFCQTLADPSANSRLHVCGSAILVLETSLEES